MNAHQRRKLQRQSFGSQQPRFIEDWKELAQVPDSETHRLEIDVEGCNGWIKEKGNEGALGNYLSTHTFYGSKHEYSTRLLRRCGFNVTCANWDDAEHIKREEVATPFGPRV